MLAIKKSRAVKIILLCLGPTIVDRGWVTQTQPFALGAVVITQEAVYALTLGCSMLWRACTNANNSAVDHALKREISRLTNRNSAADSQSTVSANSVQHIYQVIGIQ